MSNNNDDIFTFELSNDDNIDAEFELGENENIDCLFEINAAGTVWGSISGTLSNQEDLQAALDLKADKTELESDMVAVDEAIGDLQTVVTNNYNTLDSKIDSVNSDLSGDISTLTNTVNNRIDVLETSTDADIKELNTYLSDLADTVSENNTSVNNRIDGIVDSFNGDISELETAIQNEATTRAENDTLLQGDINTLRTDLTSETSNRTTADNTLQGNINTLSETVSRNYTELSGDIGELETTVNTNDTAINNKVDSINTTLTNSLNSLTSTVSSNYTTLDTKIDNTKTAIGADISDLSDTVTQNYTDLNTAITTSASTINSRIDSEVSTLNDAITNENTQRQSADSNLQSQIDAITSASDVTDIVGTYAQLQAYNTTNLPNNSIIKVLSDESRDNETTYYRWVITDGVGAWVLIGEEGPYYTKSEADNTFVTKSTTINNIPLSNNITLTASDVNALPDTTVIGDGVLTLQINGENVDTISANASTNKTINLTVPTDTSDLTNNAGYITSNALNGYATQNWVTGQNYVNSSTLTTILGDYVTNTLLSTTLNDYVTNSNLTTTLSDYALISSIPTQTSELINDSNYATVSQIPAVGNGTITINQGGVEKGTFTVNQNGNTTINLDQGGTVNQTFDGTSENAQSGVAIAGELTSNYQSKLISGTNIKTINNTSLLGSGDISVLRNTATGTNSLSILGNVYPALVDATAIGANATIINGAIGAIAIGTGANCYNTFAIQIGAGTNSTPTSLQIGFGSSNQNYQLLDGTTGLIPDDRLSTNIARTSDVADKTLSNVSSIASNSAVQTALDGKVSKSGDTMTGDLINSDDIQARKFWVCLDSVTKSTNPDRTQYAAWEIVDSKGKDGGDTWQSRRLATMEYSLQSNGTAGLIIGPYQNVADSSSAAYLQLYMTSAGVASCTFPNTTCCDGQWVSKVLSIANSVTWKQNTAEKKYSLSSYLPNDGYKYEVLFRAIAETGTTSGNFVTIGLKTDIMGFTSICEARTRTNSSTENQGSCIIPVGTGRWVSQYSSPSSNANGTYTLYAVGYRRIGSNT